MRIPHNVVGQVRPSKQPLAYIQSQATPTAFGVGVAQSIGNFGNALNTFAEELEARRGQEARIKSNGRLVQFELDQEARLDELNRNSDSMAGIDHEFSAQFMEQADGLLAEAPDEQTREYLQSQLLSLYRGYQMKAQGLERTRNEAAVDFDLKTQFETAANIVRSDPSQLDAQVDLLSASIAESHGVLPQQFIEEQTRAYLGGLTEEALKGRIDEDPEGVLEEIHSGTLKTGGEAALLYAESGGDPRAFNSFGFAGLYQFGAPRLAHLGVYKPGSEEHLKSWNNTRHDTAGKWTGKFSIPGHPNVKTVKDFLASPAAQHTAFQLHKAKMDEEIVENGFDKYLGETVQGVRITRQGLHNMIHLGGVGNTKKALEGRGNATDANGTSMLQYAKMGSKTVEAVGLDGILSPDQKNRLIERAEAGIKENVAARERALKLEETTRKQQQEHNTAQLHVGMATGMVSQTQLVQALHQGAISTDQYRTLRSDLEEFNEAPGDEETALNYRVRAMQNDLTVSEVMASRELNADQKTELVNTIDQVQRQGGVLAREDIQFELGRIGDVLGGSKGPLAKWDLATSERVSKAMTEARDLIQQEPGRAREIVDEVIERFRVSPTDIQALPNIPQWTGPRHGTKLELEARWAETKRRLDAELEAGMDEAQYMQTLQDLMEYRKAISAREK